MSKRKPTSELNDRNWDEEDEPEEAGTFSSAGRDVLKSRVIRKAKRSVHTENKNSGSIFAGFALKTADSSAPKPSLSTGVTHNFGSNLALTKKTNGTKESSGKDSTDNPEYLRQLKVLNENILSWIQKHVKENPYCILTPSFKDYERHLGDLEKKHAVHFAASSPADKDKPGSPPIKSFQFDKKETPSVFGAGSSKPLGSGFTFGQSSNSSDKSAAGVTSGSGFQFGSGLTQSTVGFGASSLTQTTVGFGASAGAKPFSFGAAAKLSTDSTAAEPAHASGAATGEDDEYQPPKAEVREIKEDGAVYSKRCKLFYQKGGQWADRGVGNLHLKLTENGRTQLIVRADTNLGNILLNILLQPTIPTKRQGKNNVFILCVPNPPLDIKKPSSEPTPMLIRVKTGEDADELLAKMEELKA